MGSRSTIFTLTLLLASLACPISMAQQANPLDPAATATLDPPTVPQVTKPLDVAESQNGSSENRRFPLQAYWDNGFQLASDNNQFHLHAGGLAMIDSVWLIGPQSQFA